MPASTMPISRDSPSSASPRTSGASPVARAASAMRDSAIIGVAIRRNSLFGSSPGFGVSSVACSRRAATAGEGSMP